MRLLDPIKYPSLLGGLNNSVPGTAIADNELCQSVNFKPQAPWIRSRGGHRLRAVAPSPITGFIDTVVGGQWAGVALQTDRVGYFTGVGPGYVNLGFDSSPGFEYEPWSVAQWSQTPFGAGGRSVFYATRFSRTPIQVSLNPDFIRPAGMPVPTFVAVAAAGAAGVLTAANYTYVFTYYDSRTGSESSFGPVSNTLALGANLQINLTGLVASADVGVDSIRIYRTLPNGTGAYYLVATIPHTTVAYSDNIPVAQQGAAASSTNGFPPFAQTVVNWQSRLWAIGQFYAAPSKLLNPEAFDPGEILQIGTPTNPVIAGIAIENALVIARRNDMVYITGTGATTWRVQQADATHGLIGAKAICRRGEYIYWLSQDGLYRGTGTGPGTRLAKDMLHNIFRDRPEGDATFSGAQKVRFSTIADCPTGGGVLICLYNSTSQGYLYHEQTDGIWKWTLPSSRVLHAGAGANISASAGTFMGDAKHRTFLGGGVELFEADDESVVVDDHLTLGTVRMPLFLAPKMLNLEHRRGVIHEVRVQWTGVDPKYVLVDPVNHPSNQIADQTLKGNVRIRVYRQNPTQGPSQFVQSEREVPLSPKRTLGKADFIDEWKAYRLFTRTPPNSQFPAQTVPTPSNTLGVHFDFVTPTAALDKPIWIGEIHVIPAVTDLSESVF